MDVNESRVGLKIHDKHGDDEPYGLDAMGKVVPAPGNTETAVDAHGNPVGYAYTGTFYGTNTVDGFTWVNLMVIVYFNGRGATSYPVAGDYFSSYPTQVPYGSMIRVGPRDLILHPKFCCPP